MAVDPRLLRPRSNPYGYRNDGTLKGSGWLGEIKTSSGRPMTELSIGVNIDGQEVEIPAIVPTLTPDEIKHLASGGEITDQIYRKAADHAVKRMSQGKSPFAQNEYAPATMDTRRIDAPGDTQLASEDQIRRRLLGMGSGLYNEATEIPLWLLEKIMPADPMTPGELRSGPRDKIRAEQFEIKEFLDQMRQDPESSRGLTLGTGMGMVVNPAIDAGQDGSQG